jgi:hypothetical protein
MGLLTPKNSKGDKKNKNKQKNSGAQGSQFKQNSKPSGYAKKQPIKTGGARGS